MNRPGCKQHALRSTAARRSAFSREPDQDSDVTFGLKSRRVSWAGAVGSQKRWKRTGDPDTLFSRSSRAPAAGHWGQTKRAAAITLRGPQGRFEMKRFAIPLIALLCLTLWGCAQPVPPQPPVSPAPPTLTRSVMCPDGSPNGVDLLTRVRYVQLSVQPLAQPGSVVPGSVPPNTNFDPVTDPSIADPTPIDPAIQNDLAMTFAANPGFARNELCPPFTTSAGVTNPGLDGILINRAQCINPSNPSDHDPSNCSAMSDTDIAANSWGLRTPSGKKYVAISLGLWRCSSGRGYCAPPFTQYHQRLVKALLDKTAGMPVSVNPIFKTPPGTDTPGLGILSALAHERGHIYWFEKYVDPPGSVLISHTTEFCNPPFYPGGRWQGKLVDIPTNRYVIFAALSPNSPVNNLPGSFPGGGATAVVDGLYRGGRFPSLLGAYSSDEDFVEAFEWSVLRNARVSNVPLSDVSVNVIGTVGADRPILTRGHGNANGAEQKLQCFDALSQSGPR
jgi:hypothetical protein